MQHQEVDFRSVLAQYREPSLWRSTNQVLTTLVPLFGLWTLMYFLMDISYWLALMLALPASGLLMRVFVPSSMIAATAPYIFKSKHANDILGLFFSVLTMTPYNCWRKLHAIHHATSGDLDRRGHGDVNLR